MVLPSATPCPCYHLCRQTIQRFQAPAPIPRWLARRQTAANPMVEVICESARHCLSLAEDPQQRIAGTIFLNAN
jgi:hypothetical protein